MYNRIPPRGYDQCGYATFNYLLCMFTGSSIRVTLGDGFTGLFSWLVSHMTDIEYSGSVHHFKCICKIVIELIAGRESCEHLRHKDVSQMLILLSKPWMNALLCVVQHSICFVDFLQIYSSSAGKSKTGSMPIYFAHNDSGSDQTIDNRENSERSKFGACLVASVSGAYPHSQPLLFQFSFLILI